MRLNAPRVVVAGLKGGSGKTTLSIGIISALRSRGLKIASFKKGPDYIDAGWLARASGFNCYNLDPFMIGEDKIISSFFERFRDSNIAVIEGNRGLFDGMDAEGTSSTAYLSQILKAPVILSIDCTKMTRTTAAIVLGVSKFDPKTKLKGVVLNQVSGVRHESIIRQSIEKYTNVPVLGALPRLPETSLPERHMGLTPFQESSDADSAIVRLKDVIIKHVDIDKIIDIARSAPALVRPKILIEPDKSFFGVRIGVVRDSAFQFYYPENIEELQKRGAEIVEVSSLIDKRLPEIDALYIGGGFPETHAISLAKNKSFRADLLKKVESGLPVYAECGGLMYLGESLVLNGKTYPMAGVFPISFSLEKKPEAHGYTIVDVITPNVYYNKGTVIRGHEFHYSRVLGVGKKDGIGYAFRMRRGRGIEGKLDGITYKNVLATYTHIHALGTVQWVEGMLSAGKRQKDERRP